LILVRWERRRPDGPRAGWKPALPAMNLLTQKIYDPMQSGDHMPRRKHQLLQRILTLLQRNDQLRQLRPSLQHRNEK
jgi:hypothetical protein